MEWEARTSHDGVERGSGKEGLARSTGDEGVLDGGQERGVDDGDGGGGRQNIGKLEPLRANGRAHRVRNGDDGDPTAGGAVVVDAFLECNFWTALFYLQMLYDFVGTSSAAARHLRLVDTSRKYLGIATTWHHQQ